MDSPRRRRARLWLGLAAATAVLAWRYHAPTWHPVYLDFVFLVTLHAIYTVFRHDGREWPLVTTALMLGFFALYLHGQVPNTLQVLDLLP